MTDQYTDFLKAKVAVVEWTGIDVPASRLHHSTLPHQADAGDLVADPFAGLFTVPYCAVKNGRRGFGTELNPDYFKYGLRYMQDIETQKLAPTLFDLLETQSPQPEEQDGN